MARKATTTVYFDGCTTVDELNARMVSLFATCSGDDELMLISQEYDKTYGVFQKKENKGKKDYEKNRDKPENLRHIPFVLLNYKDEENNLDFKRDCVLELRGRWFYVFAREGKDPEITKLYSKVLYKELHFKFSKRLGQAYWFDGIEKSKFHRHKGSLTVDESRSIHGSRIIETEDEAV